MSKSLVALMRYNPSEDSVRKAVTLSRGLDALPERAKVFIKPNIVYWTRKVSFPKWGVITTSRVVEQMIVLLKEHGIDDIIIGEGTVTLRPGDRATPAHAFKTLGYGMLKKKYGIRCLNIFERPFKKVDLGDGVAVRFNADVLESDYVVDLPVLKTHNQTVISLGIKNLKGLIDLASRKKCHNMTPGRDLHFWVSKLADKLPPIFTLIDGIYTNERGPGPDGKLKRADILVASSDILSADMVGASILGYRPEQVPHLIHAARNRGRPTDLSDIEVLGERIEEVQRFHEYDFSYSQTDEAVLPAPLADAGIKGVFYRKYDLSMCTYCSAVNGVILSAIRSAWKGRPFDDVEILTGKAMQPTPGRKKTILLGKCIYQARKDDPVIQQAIPVKGCPPNPEQIVKALHKAGIEADPGLFEKIDHLPGYYMGRYRERPEFDEGFFQVT